MSSTNEVRLLSQIMSSTYHKDERKIHVSMLFASKVVSCLLFQLAAAAMFATLLNLDVDTKAEVLSWKHGWWWLCMCVETVLLVVFVLAQMPGAVSTIWRPILHDNRWAIFLLFTICDIFLISHHIATNDDRRLLLFIYFAGFFMAGTLSYLLASRGFYHALTAFFCSAFMLIGTFVVACIAFDPAPVPTAGQLSFSDRADVAGLVLVFGGFVCLALHFITTSQHGLSYRIDEWVTASMCFYISPITIACHALAGSEESKEFGNIQ
jgi:hypothetical protein